MTEERIVLLDDQFQPIGTAPKLASHHANTPLHLAFSCYVFDRRGRILVTQRAARKKVWPSVWTNTCCGHPAPDESTEAAIARRLQTELGMSAHDITIMLPRYRYRTPPFHGIIENEFCPVYFARADEDPLPNPDEVDSWQWMTWDDYAHALQTDHDDTWSWWCKDQLKALAMVDIASAYHTN